jgi:mannose-6-phosphate isomerase-like protein (cupin superfamily)
MRISNLKKIKYKKRFEYLRSIVFEEKSLRQKGAVFEIVKFPPNTKNQKHLHHSTTEIFYIQNGKGIIVIDNKKNRVQEDDILLITPKRSHQVINNSKNDLVILIIKTNDSKNDLEFII